MLDCSVELIFLEPRYAEVRHHEPIAGFVKKEVLGLEIAMDNTLEMGRLDPDEDLGRRGGGGCPRADFRSSGYGARNRTLA